MISSDGRKTYTLISGASSGIGRALAIRLSRTRSLILHGRSRQRLDETLASCANTGQHLIWPCELLEIDGIGQGLSALLVKHGIAVECFIHSAGVLKILPIRSVTYEALNEIMNVNFFSAVEIVSVLVKKKINGDGLKDVLFLSSIASNFGAPGFSMYSASKGALDSFMRSLAVELAPRTRVNAILAGGVKTPMVEDFLSETEALERFSRDYPLGIGEPEDIVNVIEFLISPGSRWITGQALFVDGGRSVNISVKSS